MNVPPENEPAMEKWNGRKREIHVEAENCPAINASVHYVSKTSQMCAAIRRKYSVCGRAHRRIEASWWLEEWTWRDYTKIVTHPNTHAAIFYSIFAISITSFTLEWCFISHSRESFLLNRCFHTFRRERYFDGYRSGVLLCWCKETWKLVKGFFSKVN